MTTKRTAGRPPSGDKGTIHNLPVRCTEDEWEALLQLLPNNTRDRYQLILDQQKETRPAPAAQE